MDSSCLLHTFSSIVLALLTVTSHISFTVFVQVLCVGPTGTSKTLTITSKLLRHMPKEFLSEFISFSARTSANQTQDIIDSKLDKRYAVMLPYHCYWEICSAEIWSSSTEHNIIISLIHFSLSWAHDR